MTHLLSSLAAWSRGLGRFGPAVASGLVVLAITGGIALATGNISPGGSGPPCTNTTAGNHRVSVSEACTQNQNQPATSQKAGSGNAGSHPGPGGPPGRNVASWAVVNIDGTLARGEGVASSDSLDTGLYEVIFTYNVTRCAYIATLGASAGGAESLSGEIDVAPRGGNANGVFVATHNDSGAFADRGFHLLVIC